MKLLHVSSTLGCMRIPRYGGGVGNPATPAKSRKVYYWLGHRLTVCIKLPLPQSSAGVIFLILVEDDRVLLKTTRTVRDNHGVNLWLVTILLAETLFSLGDKCVVELLLNEVDGTATKAATHNA